VEVRKIIEERVREKQQMSSAKGQLAVFLLIVSGLMFFFMVYLGSFKGLFPQQYSVLFYSSLAPSLLIMALSILSFREISSDRLSSLTHIQYLQTAIFVAFAMLQMILLYLFVEESELTNILIPICSFHIFHLLLAAYSSMKLARSIKNLSTHSKNPLEAYRTFVFQFFVALVWSLIIFYT
jgi:hypothetical protein